MKGINNGGILYTVFTIIGVVGLVGIWLGIYNMFSNLTGDDLRSFVVATSYTVALLDSAISIFRADDERTFKLSIGMSIGYLLVGVIAIVGNATYRAASGQINQISEPLAWTIPFTWLIPVITGCAAFILRSADRYWGVDKKPMVNRGSSEMVTRVSKFTGMLAMVFALLGSAFGTYEVTFAITHSFWNSMIYVATVELAIFAFASLTSATEDLDVFFWAFLTTVVYFMLAIVIQLTDAFKELWVDSANVYIQFLSNEFVLLPPIITVGVLMSLLVYNQRKTGRLMGRGGGQAFSRGQQQYQQQRQGIVNRPPQRPQVPQTPPAPPVVRQELSQKSESPERPVSEEVGFEEMLNKRLGKERLPN